MSGAVRVLAALALLALATGAARAEELVAALSKNQIAITPEFVGEELILYGTITGTDAFATAEGRDIVVVVCGPPTVVTVRRRERVAGIWINGAAAAFRNVPGYHYIASTRQLEEIAPPQFFGCKPIDLPDTGPWQQSSGLAAAEAAAFSAAIVEGRTRDGLFVKVSGPEAVQITEFALFETRIPIPGTAPVGAYDVRVCLFREQQEVHCVARLPLYVEKRGMERLIFELAHERPWLYGLAAVALSLLAGWLAALTAARS